MIVREWFDKLCRIGIKAAMLTGVAFTMAACYGPPPERYLEGDPEFQEDQEQVEEQLQSAAEGAE